MRILRRVRLAGASRHLALRAARHLAWQARGRAFASERVFNDFEHVWSAFSCPVVNHPTQRHLVHSKVENMKKAATAIDGLVLRPGEIFSFWNHIGRPSAKAGFLSGPTFESGAIRSSVGGGLCQISGLLFNLALEAGLEILERHSHTLDAYGENRYLPLGRDATVAWLSKDLAFRNSTPFNVQIRVEALSDRAHGRVAGDAPRPCEVEFSVQTISHNDDQGARTDAILHRTLIGSVGEHKSDAFHSRYRSLAP